MALKNGRERDEKDKWFIIEHGFNCYFLLCKLLDARSNVQNKIELLDDENYIQRISVIVNQRHKKQGKYVEAFKDTVALISKPLDWLKKACSKVGNVGKGIKNRIMNTNEDKEKQLLEKD